MFELLQFSRKKCVGDDVKILLRKEQTHDRQSRSRKF